MTAHGWRFALEIQREDESLVSQVPVTIDTDPFRECLRFAALRRGVTPALALAVDGEIEPVWDARRGQPYLAGLRSHGHVDGMDAVASDFGTACFNAPARKAAAELVQQGALKEGDRFRALPLAFAREDTNGIASPRFKAQVAVPALPVVDADLPARLAGVTSSNSSGEQEGDIPALIPRAVFEEAAELTRVDSTRETGGLLIGHLCRDRAGGDLFVEVTAQLPARHVEAASTRLTFTSETWTEFRSALALRQRGEIMVGWWHSHPVREWCKSCAEEKREQCSLRGDFLSEDDRLLHRAIFPRAYSLALVVNDVSEQAPTYSMFGWRRGAIELRAFHVVDALPALATATTASITTVHA